MGGIPAGVEMSKEPVGYLRAAFVILAGLPCEVVPYR
jgi:hypothetical protein